MATMKLAEELACYEANRAMLVEKHDGEYVLIKGDKIVDYFTAEVDAISAGYDKFGSDPFLVRLCAATEIPVLFTSLYIGGDNSSQPDQRG